ncbi:phosphoribosylglycinamide formyltransferase [Neisseria animaloris]|uniref:phosphoribosylglycinamide formyltransferase n=1 Tax=Neisseria animaloris TaxID=326522 RepID=UPI001F18464D|nr:phosphoribosylglycinamide formyltransferase [Neisseria animaloris]
MMPLIVVGVIMKKFSTNSEINFFIHSLLKRGWKIQNRKKHNILVAPNNRRIAIPSTPSDYKAIYSFTTQIKYLFQELN